MKGFLAPSALVAAGLLAACVAIPLMRETHENPGGFYFSARIASNAAGNVQVYWDDGSGFREDHSSIAPLSPDGSFSEYRLPIPPGVIRAIRFDPIDREGTVTIEEARIVDSFGRVRANLPPGRFKPANQIQAMHTMGGRLEMVPTPDANDPQTLVEFNPPLVLAVPWGGIAFDFAVRAAVVFAIEAALLLVLARFPALRTWLAGAARGLAGKPFRCIAAVSAAAVIASAYPVVFMGRSYVSPNQGAILLYDNYPTLPGYSSGEVADMRGSDVGATMWQFVPYSILEHRTLADGHAWPLWNRYDACGTPLLGQGYSMFGDPLNILPIAANGAAWAWDLKFLIAKWLLALGLGLLVLELAGHLPSALIISLGAPFAGFFLYRFNHPAYFSFCYSPWILLCWLMLARRKGARPIAAWCSGLILANFALINSGTVKESYMLLLTMNFSGACVLISSGAPARDRILKLAAAAGAFVVLALVAAPMWATFLQTLGVATTPYDHPIAFQLQPGVLLGAFDEAFYRPLVRGGLVFNPSASFLVLAGLLYFLATLRTHFSNRAAMAIAMSALIPLAIAFGLVPAAWIERLPLLGNVTHIDNSFSCPLILLWSVLAGVGFSAAARRLATPEGRGDLVVAGLLLFALVFSWIGFSQASQRLEYGPGTVFTPIKLDEPLPVDTFVWGYLAVLIAGVAGLFAVLRRVTARRSLTPGTAIFGICCLGALLWRQGLQARSVGFDAYVARPGVRANLTAQSPAVEFVRKAVDAQPSRSMGLRLNLVPGWNGVYGLEGIGGPEALSEGHYRALLADAPVEWLSTWLFEVTRAGVPAAHRFLDFLNVRYYLDAPGNRSGLGGGLVRILSADMDVYESPTVWPRAFFTDRVGVYSMQKDFLSLVEHGDGRPFAAVQASDLGSAPRLPGLDGNQSTRTLAMADHYRLRENSTSFEIDAPHPGLAVLTEVWWRGYPHATVDGRRTRLVRVNHAFQGIVIDSAGRHQITVEYWPSGFAYFEAAAAAGLALIVASWIWVIRFSSPRRPSASPTASREG